MHSLCGWSAVVSRVGRRPSARNFRAAAWSQGTHPFIAMHTRQELLDELARIYMNAAMEELLRAEAAEAVKPSHTSSPSPAPAPAAIPVAGVDCQ